MGTSQTTETPVVEAKEFKANELPSELTEAAIKNLSAIVDNFNMLLDAWQADNKVNATFIWKYGHNGMRFLSIDSLWDKDPTLSDERKAYLATLTKENVGALLKKGEELAEKAKAP